MKKITVILVGMRASIDAYIKATPELDEEARKEMREPRTFAYDSDDDLDEVFQRFNVGEDEIANRYRAAKNRSLSVGDVILIEEDGRRAAWLVAPLGFTPLPVEEADTLIEDSRGGP